MAISVGPTVSSQGDSALPFADLAHTVDPGTNLLIVSLCGWAGSNADIGAGGPNSNNNVASATWTASGQSGQLMTRLYFPNDVNNWGWTDVSGVVEMYVLASPLVGAGNLSFASGNQGPSEGLSFVAFNVLDVNISVGTAGVRTVFGDGANSSAPSLGPISCEVGDLIVSSCYEYNNDIPTKPAGSTNLYDALVNSAHNSVDHRVATSTSENMVYSSYGNDGGGGLIAIAEGFVAPPTGIKGGHLLLGAGG